MKRKITKRHCRQILDWSSSREITGRQKNGNYSVFLGHALTWPRVLCAPTLDHHRGLERGIFLLMAHVTAPFHEWSLVVIFISSWGFFFLFSFLIFLEIRKKKKGNSNLTVSRCWLDKLEPKGVNQTMNHNTNNGHSLTNDWSLLARYSLHLQLRLFSSFFSSSYSSSSSILWQSKGRQPKMACHVSTEVAVKVLPIVLPSKWPALCYTPSRDQRLLVLIVSIQSFLSISWYWPRRCFKRFLNQ